MLSSRLQELAAVIADLEARQHNLATEVARLSGEIDMTQGQIEEAKDKRTQEHESHVQEQLDFDNSVAACEKAIEMLVKFYGYGSPRGHATCVDVLDLHCPEAAGPQPARSS